MLETLDCTTDSRRIRWDFEMGFLYEAAGYEERNAFVVAVGGDAEVFVLFAHRIMMCWLSA